ncbi:MAG: zf-HC2 domain-containing protein [Candidatus Schekmanbacteria bacterium]|nr:zf-HC2 domain-containing protein [Candidatus Schekmanbacteria bacterium]
MLTCNDATRLLSDSQEDRLSFKARMSLTAHLMMCSGCRNFGRHLQILREAARAFAAGEDERTGEEQGQP